MGSDANTTEDRCDAQSEWSQQGCTVHAVAIGDDVAVAFDEGLDLTLPLERHDALVSVITAASDVPCGCMVVDYDAIGDSPLHIIDQLHRQGVCMPVVLVGGDIDSNQIISLFRRGVVDIFARPFDAKGFVKTVHTATNRSRDTVRGGDAARRLCSLTNREREVLGLVVEGHKTDDIAKALHRTRKTIEFHRHNIMLKTGAENVAALTRMATLAEAYANYRL